MEDKKEKATAWLKGKVEAFRGWKRIWKVLVVLGVIATVAVSVFFSIPSPYADAWDDLLLPYPEQFPEPGVYVKETPEYQQRIIYLRRNDIILPTIDRDYDVGKRQSATPYWYRDAWLIANIKILNYVDVLYEYTNKAEDRTYFKNTACMIVGKVDKIFNQRVCEDEDKKEVNEGDIITVLMSNASSKEAVSPYPEIGINQNWLFALKQAHHSTYSARFVPPDIPYCMTDYVAEGIGNVISIPVKKDKNGNIYADMRDVEAYIQEKDGEQVSSEGIWNMVPKTLIDEQWRITDMEAFCGYFDSMLEQYPYRISIINYEARPAEEIK